MCVVGRNLHAFLQMGNYKSNAIFKGKASKVCASIPDVLNEQAVFEDQYVRPIEIQVAHYTPASFPIIPNVTSKTMEICRRSWEKIILPVMKEGQEVSGLTIFYTEFYDTLEVFDRTGKFESVLRQHSVGMDAAAAKGAILIRIIHYALALDPEAEKSAYMLFTLGKSHNHKRIRPWQYSVFIQVLLNTISSRLGQDATEDVMSAWVHLFAYILRSILPVAIRGLVNETEVDINVSTDLGDSKIQDEILQQDEVREMKKILAGGRPRADSRNYSNGNSRSVSHSNSRSGSAMNSPRSSHYAMGGAASGGAGVGLVTTYSNHSTSLNPQSKSGSKSDETNNMTAGQGGGNGSGLARNPNAGSFNK